MPGDEEYEECYWCDGSGECIECFGEGCEECDDIGECHHCGGTGEQ